MEEDFPSIIIKKNFLRSLRLTIDNFKKEINNNNNIIC